MSSRTKINRVLCRYDKVNSMFKRESALNMFAACSLSLMDRVGPALAVKFGRPESEITTLISVRQCEHFTVGWLSEVLRLTHSAAVRIADRLERDGLLQRITLPNRRYVGLMLTNAGTEFVGEVLKERRNILESHFSVIPDELLEQVMPVIETLLGNVTTDELTAYQTCRQCDAGMCTGLCAVDKKYASLDLGPPRVH